MGGCLPPPFPLPALVRGSIGVRTWRQIQKPERVLPFPNQAGVGKARAARSAYAAKASETTRIVIRDIQASGVKTLATIAIARALQALGIKTPAARHESRPVQASRVAGGLSRRSPAQTSGRPTCPCATSHSNRLQSLGPSATCLGVGLGLPRHSLFGQHPVQVRLRHWRQRVVGKALEVGLVGRQS
jgi:hypothetical protein